jgi:DNA polymerase V
MFALIDGHNFYVSCERLFRPSLNGVPVIVLSNNDGCAIARSEEAKRLGVKMGMPWFQIRKEMGDAGIVALSANFALYGDLSNRMMSVAAGLGPAQEIYSIDESFISLAGMPGDLTARADAVRHRIRKWVGIPCGIGIGATKTLAKLANHIAKAADRKPGSYPAELAHVCNLAAMPLPDVRAVLAATDLAEIWGVGPRLTEQLKAAGLSTALDVAQMDPTVARSRWSVVFERTVRELQGVSCIGLDDAPAPRKEIASTRSFGHPVQSEQALVQAVTEFVSRASEKLRRQESLAGRLMVFIHTSPFRRGEPQYSRSVTVPLRRPTSDTAILVRAAVRGLRLIYKPGYNFAKAGVHLVDLQSVGVQQGELALDADNGDRSALMQAMDKINETHGKRSLWIASAGIKSSKREWEMRQDLRTPLHTTKLRDIPIALA